MLRTKLEVIRTRLEVIRTRLEVIRTRVEVIRTRLEVIRTSHFPGGLSRGWDQESWRIGETCLIFS